jgi:CRISPR-associated endonuclease Csn1
MLKRIVDPSLRRKIHAASAKTPEELTGHFGRTKRLKIARKTSDAIDVLDKFGRFNAAVLPTDNHHLDIVQMRDGIWHAFGASRHAVSQPDWRPRWEQEKCGGKLVMRLNKGDMVELQGDGEKGNIMTVIRLSASSGMVHLGQHFASGEFEGGSMQKPNAYAPRSLQKRHARAVHVDAAGRMTYRASNMDKVRTRLIGASRSEP